jgi:hypothetical protein
MAWCLTKLRQILDNFTGKTHSTAVIEKKGSLLDEVTLIAGKYNE